MLKRFSISDIKCSKCIQTSGTNRVVLPVADSIFKAMDDGKGWTHGVRIFYIKARPSL